MTPQTQGIRYHSALKGTQFGIKLTLDFLRMVYIPRTKICGTHSEEKRYAEGIVG